MAEKLKDQFFTKESISEFSKIIKKAWPGFDEHKFKTLVLNEDWEGMELKERMRHTSISLHQVLPDDYCKALDILKKIAPEVKGFECMTLPDYVEVFGMEDWEASLPALAVFTRYGSSEFAIRPFLDKDPQRVMKFMNQCADNEHENVRRFASEGCRPRLPWAMALSKFKKDPTLIISILEKLKNDPSEFVRRSVANNLNDISKDNPDMMLTICEKWFGVSTETDWIVKHACRSLLKAGNPRALMLFGFGDPKDVAINITKHDQTVPIGHNFLYTFNLEINGKQDLKIRLEYAIDYMKANGKHSRKVFQISENTYNPGVYSFNKKQSFQDMTTRKHYQGLHRISLITNGIEKATAEFKVTK